MLVVLLFCQKRHVTYMVAGDNNDNNYHDDSHYDDSDIDLMIRTIMIMMMMVVMMRLIGSHGFLRKL